MRYLLLLAGSVLLIAASPAQDARQLMEQGRDREAFQLIEKSAQSGDPDAVDYLAWFHDEGRLVPQDHARAVELYRRAAQAGNRHAQWRLGVMLDLGLGTTEAPAEAFVWIKKAADQGSSSAYASLGVMYAMGRGVSVDYQASQRSYRKAAELGERHGFYGVGILYARGEGVPQDLTEALAWMLVAASLGDQDATKAIEGNGFRDADGPSSTERARQIAKEFGLRLEFKFEDQRPPPGRTTNSKVPIDV